MTYGNFQRLSEASAYSKMRREQREDDEKQAEFYKQIEEQRQKDVEQEQERIVENICNEDNDLLAGE